MEKNSEDLFNAGGLVLDEGSSKKPRDILPAEQEGSSQDDSVYMCPGGIPLPE